MNKDQLRQFAALTLQGVTTWVLFSVSTDDQIDAEIYLDGNTNEWLIFIEDLTSRTAFGQEFAYTTNLTRAAWLIGISSNSGGPVPPMNATTFTNARWVSNWDSWQPITSSAAAYYVQLALKAVYGGQVATTQPTASGTSFTLVPCPTC